MATVKGPYGPWSRSVLEALRERGLFKVEAFVAHLSERGVRVDRTLVSHWRAGRTHLPADLLPILAEFTGRPDLVYGPYLREAGCEVVRLPRGALEDRDLVDLILDAGATLGRLQRALFDARRPSSPGGEAVTPDERAELLGRVDELIQRLADLRARLARRCR